MQSPIVTTTEPWACLASFPVSKVIVLPSSKWISWVNVLGIIFSKLVVKSLLLCVAATNEKLIQ
jgi:hypothetical protein